MKKTDKELDADIKRVFESNPELGFQLILAKHECKARVFGAIGYTITDPTKLPEPHLENLFLMEDAEKTLSYMSMIKMRQRLNPERKYQNFILNLNDVDLWEHLEKMWHESPKSVVRMVRDLNPEYFSL